MVSIIIPVYNCEKYIKKCLMSLINQHYTDIEIIIIDDGSRDNSLSICREMEVQDKRIKVVHQKNQGVSSARNHGLYLSKGEYIAFVDGDDWVEEDYIDSLLNKMLDNNADMAVCGILRENIKGEIIEKCKYRCVDVLNKDEAMESALSVDGFQGYLCNKLFKKAIISSNELRLDDNITILEDLLFVIRYLNKCKIITVDQKPLYHYVNHDDSARQSCSKALHFEKKWLTEIDALTKIINEIEDVSLQKVAKARKALSCSFYLKRMHFCNFSDKELEKELIKSLRENVIFVLKFKPGDRNWRLTTYLCAISPKLEFLLYDLLLRWKNE